MMRLLPARLAALRSNVSGVALSEFAFILPIFITMTLTGAELTNYVTTRMRVSQLALHLADDAARMGSGSLLSAKTITETDINDLFIGAGLQAGELDLVGRGRVTLYDLEPVANPNTTNKYKIVWKRCYGSKASYASPYGAVGATNLDGIGPAGRMATAQDDNATMFVEVYYEYKPLVGSTLVPSTTMKEIASMSVRDRRDLSQIYNNENAPVATC